MVEPQNFIIVSINAVFQNISLNVQTVRPQNGRAPTNVAPRVPDNLAVSQLLILDRR